MFLSMSKAKMVLIPPINSVFTQVKNHWWNLKRLLTGYFSVHLNVLKDPSISHPFTPFPKKCFSSSASSSDVCFHVYIFFYTGKLHTIPIKCLIKLAVSHNMSNILIVDQTQPTLLKEKYFNNNFFE